MVVKPGRSRRYQVPSDADRSIAALLALRDQVISPILAGVRGPDVVANPPLGQRPTVTTKPSASTCRASSNTYTSTAAAPLPR